MSLFSAVHPEVTSGAILGYGFHKVSQQTKTILVNMILEFVNYRNQLFLSDIPDLADFQGDPKAEEQNLYITRDFAAVERKFPSIVVSIQNATESKPYIGSDNYLYTNRTTVGSAMSYEDIYAGMGIVECVITILCASSDQRSKLADLLSVCFSNCYRGQFIYKGDDDSQFIITPGIEPIAFGSEQETQEQNPLQLIYLTTMSLVSHIEYQFSSGIDGLNTYTQLKEIKGYGDVISVPMIGF